MKKTTKKDIVFFAPPTTQNSKADSADHLRGLFHYFGYAPITPEVGGFLGFEHKTFEGNKVIYTPYNGCLCKITFCQPWSGSFAAGSESVYPKTWKGLFTAVRTHTRRLIAMRDAQYKIKAA